MFQEGGGGKSGHNQVLKSVRYKLRKQNNTWYVVSCYLQTLSQNGEAFYENLL